VCTLSKIDRHPVVEVEVEVGVVAVVAAGLLIPLIYL
jgi:hypothetical protein